MKAKTWHLYILRCGNGNLYTGITTDVRRRMREHEEGRGAKALRGKGPLILVLKKKIGSMPQALKAEYKVKQLAKPEKERLVTGRLSFGNIIKKPV